MQVIIIPVNLIEYKQSDFENLGPWTLDLGPGSG
jgi:hypothetical protein